MKQKPALWVLGLMSGTSLDGVDAAMLRTDGQEILEIGPSAFRPYSAAERAGIAQAFGRWPGEPDVAEAAEIVEAAHVEIASRFPDAALIGFHGQTLAHEPRGRGTHQAGDGRVLASVLGREVAWDFRSADVALGGEGAPLVPFYHHALARRMGAKAPLAFLNLGGVGNLTYVDPTRVDPADPEALLAFDTGPANAPINDLMQARFGLDQDAGGALGLQGIADPGVVTAFLRHPHFFRMAPKSLDRNAFDLLPAVADLASADAAATLVACVAASVAEGVAILPAPIRQLLVAGGGRKNAAIMAGLHAALPGVEILDIDASGLDGDMIEAQAFAFLAARIRRGLPTSGPKTTGVPALVGGGRISAPEAG
jgi:anhydro-N-acetylmuramic acid kinase